jgi:hypothetical protein
VVSAGKAVGVPRDRLPPVPEPGADYPFSCRVPRSATDGHLQPIALDRSEVGP